MIPKIIHYCWFGKSKKTRLLKKCIESWKIYLQDYEIIEWNESNCDLTRPFILEAYKQKKWAFVADFIRLEKLYEFGGVYLDTDMLVIKPFESLMNNTCFFGAEDENFISCGVIGANKKNKFIKDCFNKYEFISLKEESNFGKITIPKIITETFKNKYNYYLPFREIIKIDEIVIYPFQYFYPLPFQRKLEINNYKEFILPETCAIHLWNASWVEFPAFKLIREKQYFEGIKKMFDEIIKNKDFSSSYFRKIASSFRQSIK